MRQQWLYTLAFAAAFLGLVLFIEYLYTRFEIKAEFTRKTAHIAATIFSLLFLTTFQSYEYVIILGVIFFLLLFVGKKLNLFKSIYSVDRKTSGSYMLPIAICLLFVIAKENDNNLLFVLPLLTLGVSDPLAGIVGTIYKGHSKKIVLANHKFDKTIIGSTVFLLSTLILSVIVLSFFSFSGNQLLLLSLSLAIIATLIEMISINGFDNLTVPLTMCLILWLVTGSN